MNALSLNILENYKPIIDGLSDEILSSATGQLIQKTDALKVVANLQLLPLVSNYHVTRQLDDDIHCETISFYTSIGGNYFYVLRTDEQSDLLNTKIFKYCRQNKKSISMADVVVLMNYHQKESML